MGERRCFICQQGLGRRGGKKVRLFGSDGLRADSEICRPCMSVLRPIGEMKVERAGVTITVRERILPEPLD